MARFSLGNRIVGTEAANHYIDTCAGTHWIVTAIWDDTQIEITHDPGYPEEDQGYCSSYRVLADCFELSNKYEETKPMADISNPVTALMDMDLDADTKILRKYGFEDNAGYMDSRGRDALLNHLWKEHRVEFAQQLRKLEEADKPEPTV
jgi:hypothetical protein